MIPIVIIVVMLVLLGIVAMYWFRNKAVYRYRASLINKIHDLEIKEIEQVHRAQISGDRGIEYPIRWRFAEFDSVSYNRMFYQIWKPLGSFYRENFPRIQLRNK